MAPPRKSDYPAAAVPLLSLSTSAPPLAPGARDQLFRRLSALLATEFRKPEAYVMVLLGPPVALFFAGNSAPACFAQVKNVDHVSGPHAEILSGTLCTMLSEGLGVAKDRIYIEFSGVQGALWGWNGGTFG